MRIFITGATGFIGTALVKKLAQTDHTLQCLVRQSRRTDAINNTGAKVIIGDVTDRESLAEGMQGCDWVINLANLYTFWERDKSLYKRVNVEGTRNVLECALSAGIKKVIHVSTVGIYGIPKECPFTEESAVGPDRFSEYFRTKYEGDLIAWELYENRDLPLVVIYPCAVLGAGDPKASGIYIRNLVKRRLPASVMTKSTMTFVDVNDVAEAIIRAAEKSNNIGEKYIVGKYPLTFGEINSLVSEISGVRLPLLSLPDWLTMLNARLLTLISRLTKKPPPWGLSVDQIAVMKAGFIADGSKAEKELGITYSPIRTALKAAIDSFR